MRTGTVSATQERSVRAMISDQGDGCWLGCLRLPALNRFQRRERTDLSLPTRINHAQPSWDSEGLVLVDIQFGRANTGPVPHQIVSGECPVVFLSVMRALAYGVFSS